VKTFVFHKDDHHETVDHILEFLYDKIEKSKAGHMAGIEKLFRGRVEETVLTEIVSSMKNDNLIEESSEGLILTKAGTKKAELLVRGYRLAQRLMVDALGISPENANKAAHYMEHIVEDEILDAISAFLGYPDSSPDGKTIPRSSARRVLSLRPVLCRLSDFEIGKPGKIQYIQNPEKSLAHLGIMPGEEVRLIQKKPSVVLEIGHTTIALDKSIATCIFVQSL